MGEELKDRVEVQKLNACEGEDFIARHSLEDLLHNVRGSLIAVTDRVFNQISIRVNQSVINAPTVHADALDRSSEPPRSLTRRAQSGFDPVEDARQVPAQMPIAPIRRVIKPMRFLKQQFVRFNSDQKDAPAARAKVN